MLPTTQTLLALLSKAHADHAEPEVIERLRWFVYFSDRKSVSETCKEFNIARSTFYRWHKRLDVADLSALENVPKSALLVEKTQNSENKPHCPACGIWQWMKEWRTHSTKRPTIFFAIVAALVNITFFLLIALPQVVGAASSWAPTLLVNTEAFQVIDDTDSTADLYLQFGGTLNKRLTYDRTIGTFIFNDDLEVAGSISGVTIHAQDALTSSGQLIVEINNTEQAGILVDVNAETKDSNGDTLNPHIFFGYNNTFDTNLFRQKADTLYTDDSLWIGETASGARVHAQDSLSTSGSLVVENSISGAGLSDCDDATNSKLLWDASTGTFSCGADTNTDTHFTGTGSLQDFFDNRYVEVGGDTMTGALTISTGSSQPALTLSGSNVASRLYDDGYSEWSRSASGNVLTLKNQIEYQSSATYATEFDGNDYISASSSAMTQIFTIAAWIKTSVSRYPTIIACAGGGCPQIRLSGGKLQLLKAQTANIGASNTSVNTNTWTHIAVTYDVSGNYQFYVNGSADGNGTSLQTFTLSNAVTIGSNGTPGAESYTGSIDDLRVYDNALSSGEIEAIYNGGNGTQGDSASGIHAWWKFDDGTGFTAADSSGNSYDGTLGGSTTWVDGKVSAGLVSEISTLFEARDGGSATVKDRITLGNNYTDARIKGATLSFFTNGTERIRLTSGGLLGIGTTTPTEELEVVGTISGSTLQVTDSLYGAGLSDCDDATNSKLLWDASTGTFSCGADTNTDTHFTGTGSLQDFFDNRFVNKSGDTMTGALIIDETTPNANGALQVRGLLSGFILHAQDSITTSGSLVITSIDVPSTAGNEGANSASTFTSDDTVGAGSTPAWISPSNASASDGSYAETESDYGWNENSIKLYVGGTFTGDDKSTGDDLPYSLTTKTYGGISDTWGLTLSASDINSSTFGFGVSYAGGARISEYLRATNFGFSIPDGSTIVGVVAEVYVQQGGGDAQGIVDHMSMTVYYGDPAIPGTIIKAESGKLGIGTATAETEIEVIGTISGSTIFAQDGLSSSGTLSIEGESVFDSTVTINNPAILTSTGNEGINDASSFASDNSIGSASWNNTGNASTSDFSYATSPGNYGDTENSIMLFVGYTPTGDNKSTSAALGTIHSDTYGSSSDSWGVSLTPSDVNSTGFGFGVSYSGAAGDTRYLRATNFGFSIPSDATITGVEATVEHGQGAGDDEAQVDYMGMKVYYSIYAPGSVITATGGRLGIRTATPETALEVVGTVSGSILHAQDILTSSGGLVAEGAVTFGSSLTALGDITFDTTTFFVDSSENKVGIGTITPETELEVVGTISGSSLTVSGLQNCDTIDTDAAGNFSCGTDQSGGGGDGFTGTGSLQDFFDNRYVEVGGDTMTGALTIDPDSDSTTMFQVNDANGGNPVLNVDSTNEQVGIGTSSPVEQLHIQAPGNTNAKAAIVAGNEGYSSTLYLGTPYQGNANNGLKAAIIAEGQSTYGRSKLYFSLDNTAGNSRTYDASVSNARMTITSAGNVGIGTTSPDEVLDVTTAGASARIWNSTTMSGDQEAGVLKIVHSASAEANGKFDETKPHGGIDFQRFWNTSPVTLAKIHNYGSSGSKGGLIFMTSDTPWVMDLTPAGDALFNGKVAIGTTSPTVELEVVGTISGSTLYFGDMLSGSGYAIFRNVTDSITSFQIYDADGGTPVFSVDTINERVGIGTVAPTATLDVTAQEYQTGAYLYASGASVLALDSYSGTSGSGSNAHIMFGYRNVFDTELYRHGGSGSGGLVIKTQQTSTSDNAFRVVTQNGSTDNTVFKIRADGAVTAEGSFTGGGADLAEWFPTADSGMTSGDIACLDPQRPKHVKRCNLTSLQMIGIVSTKPGFIGNSQQGISGQASLIGLIGQVPVKVIGNVRIGDSITLSKSDAIGKKAGSFDPTICIAMEEHRGNEVGVVTCLLGRNTGSPVNSASVADYLLQNFRNSMRSEDW